MAKIEKESLRPQILEAARKLLLTDGIQHVSMRKIAGVIGYTATSIYYHFKNKDELIHALIDEGHEKLFHHLKQVQDNLQPGTAPLSRIEAHLRAFVQFGLDNREYYEVMYMLHSPEFSSFPNESNRRTRQSLDLGADLYQTAKDQNLVNGNSSLRITASVAAMLHGYISMVLLHRLDAQFDHEQILEDIISCIMRGIQTTQVAA